jgi:hypothetical protein
MHRRIGTPVLTGLRLEPVGLEVDSRTVVPERLPDLFGGVPLFILGRYHGAPTGALVLHALDGESEPWSRTLNSVIAEESALSSVWARGHVRELEDRYAGGRGDPALLMQQIVETSLKFGVLCRFTAFVAVDVQEVVNPSGQVQRVTQPVESAAGWEMLGTNRAPANANGIVGAPAFCVPPPAPAFCAPPPVARAPMPEALRKVKREVEQAVQPGADMVTMGKLPQTPGLKKALEAAIEEARNLQHEEVDTEHLLLGLLHEPDAAVAGMFLKLGLTLDQVRSEVLRRRGRGTGAGLPTTSGYERFTPPALRVMQQANQEAQRFNHEYISTEHLLLALLAEGTGLAATILNDLVGGGTGGALTGAPAVDPGAAASAPPKRGEFWK